jgi:MoaA/NifB/PqqE/SkfB family radical SAM enzyme
MNLTLGISYKCNSKCKTCFIWKKKNFEEELSLEEFKKIFKKIGKRKLYLLIVTGGEPFMHKDLVDICFFAEKYCKPDTIVIPTNCILEKKVVRKTKEILSKCKKSHFTINLSLDGIGKKQDLIRGVPGNFNRTIDTFYELKKLEKKYKNFDVSIHTVISKFNYKDFFEIFKFVNNNLKPNNYITEVAENRNELYNMNEKITPDLEEYSYSIDFLINNLKNKKLNSKQALRLEYYKLVKMILKQKKQIIPCYAGIASAQIDPTGEVWFCCVRAESIGNLRNVNFDLMKLWYNKKAKEQRKSIANNECYCPLASANYTNISLDKKMISRVIYNMSLSRFYHKKDFKRKTSI